MKKILLFLVCNLIIVSAYATTFYLDNTATGSHNGSSWVNAWTNWGGMTGLAAGDIVYISGGPSGSSQTYIIDSEPSYPCLWLPVGGTATRITYQIGQDSNHNGTIIIKSTNAYGFITQGNNFNLSGNAGDGQYHILLTNYTQGIINDGNETNYRITYMSFGNFSGTGRPFDIRGTKNVEIDHIYIKMTNMDCDTFMYWTCAGTTWDNSSVHDCIVWLPNSGDGNGADGIETGGGIGHSIYNNFFGGWSNNYTGGQHQDGWQDTGNSSFIKVYNNTFLDIGNYSTFGDAYNGGFWNLLIYNNISLVGSGIHPGAAFVVGPDGGYAGSLPCMFSNVVVANNMVVDYAAQNGGGIGGNTSIANIYTNCLVVNNLSINGGRFATEDGGTGVVYSLNLTNSASKAVTNFSSYTTFKGTTNNMHFKAIASDLINQGTNLTAFFTTDKDGVVRDSIWDVGAYEYVPFSVHTINGKTLHITH